LNSPHDSIGKNHQETEQSDFCARQSHDEAKSKSQSNEKSPLCRFLTGYRARQAHAD
jgi:hypothetical protein